MLLVVLSWSWKNFHKAAFILRKEIKSKWRIYFANIKKIKMFYYLQSPATEWPLLTKLYFYFEEIRASDFRNSVFICTIEYELGGSGPCSQKGWTANLLYLGTSQTSTNTPLRSEVAVL